MTFREPHKPLAGDFGIDAKRLADALHLENILTRATPYDPELLYVECRECGQPVLWESGRTTELLLAGGIDLRSLDERCLIVADGCPTCHPKEKGFNLAVVRIAGLSPDEAVHMAKPAGHS